MSDTLHGTAGKAKMNTEYEPKNIFITQENWERLCHNPYDHSSALKSTLDALKYKTLSDYHDAVKNSKDAKHADYICYIFNATYYKNVNSKYKN